MAAGSPGHPRRPDVHGNGPSSSRTPRCCPPRIESEEAIVPETAWRNLFSCSQAGLCGRELPNKRFCGGNKGVPETHLDSFGQRLQWLLYSTSSSETSNVQPSDYTMIFTLLLPRKMRFATKNLPSQLPIRIKRAAARRGHSTDPPHPALWSSPRVSLCHEMRLWPRST